MFHTSTLAKERKVPFAVFIIAGVLLAIGVAVLLVKMLQYRVDREQVYQEHMRALQADLETPLEEVKQALIQRPRSRSHLPVLAKVIEIGLRIDQIKKEKRASTRLAMIYRCRSCLATLQRQFDALPQLPSVAVSNER